MSDHTLFAVAPFVSIVVLAVAAALRARHYDWAGVGPAPPLAPMRRGFARQRLLAIGFLGVLAGHVVMLAWPDQLLRWNRDFSRLVAFELAHFALGACALVGVGAAIRRRVLQRTANGARVVEAAFLGVLLLTLVSGLGVAVVYRWATAWSAVTVTRYARSLLSLQPNLEALEAMPYLVKLHIFSSFIVVALLAFTPLIDVLLKAPLRAIGAVVGPVASAVDRRRRLLQERLCQSSRSLMWPEEED